MHVEWVRDFCLSFDDVEECQPFGPENLVYKIKGKMFLFDPMKHESGIVNDKKCLCKKDLILDDLENHIDFIQSKYPFGNSRAEDLPKLILLTFKDGKPLEFYEVNWQFYNE